MKTLTLNKKQILFGMLVVSLGLSKSWTQTAEREGSLNLATVATSAAEVSPSSDAPAATRRVTPTYNIKLTNKINECKGKKDVTVTVSSEVAGTRNKTFVNADGEIVEGDAGESVLKYFVSYSYECQALDFTVSDKLEVSKNEVDQILAEKSDTDTAKTIEDEILAAIEAHKEKAEQEKRVAECEIKMDGDEEIDLTDADNSEDRIKCLSRALNNKKLDRDKREEFREEIRIALNQKAEDLRDALEDAAQEESPSARRKARREAMKMINEVESLLDGDTKKYFKTDLRIMKDSAKDYNRVQDLSNSISNLENNYSQNPMMRWWQVQRVENMKREIDRIGGKYNERDNPYYTPRGKDGDYSPAQQARLNWADSIYCTAVGALTQQATSCDGGSPISGSGNTVVANNDPNFTRSSRVSLDTIGLTYVPQYISAGSNIGNVNGNFQGQGNGSQNQPRVYPTANNQGGQVYNPNFPTQNFQQQRQFNNGSQQQGQFNGIPQVGTPRRG